MYRLHFSDKKKTLLFLLIFSILLIVVCFCILTPHYETDDDFTLAGIASGIQGYPSAFMIFCNVILGYIFKTLYTLLPAINWFVIGQYVFIFLSFFAIGYVLIQKIGLAFGSVFF